MRPFVFSWLVLALGISGCRYGSASFKSEIAKTRFDPSGTVFSYVDAHDDNFVEDELPRVAVFMSWLTFNPEQDLRDRSGTELENMRHELGLRDALSLVFHDQAAMKVNADLSSESVNGVFQGEGTMRARLHFAPERLLADSSYADVLPWGSQQNVDVELSQADFDKGGGVAGTVRVRIERTDADPEYAAFGTFEGTFVAPLVEERVAEQNLAVLASETWVGLPLPPRELPEEE